MSTISTEERRDVARRLRDLDYADLQESLICAYLDVLGIEGYTDWIGIAQHLADLIEPQPITGDTSDGYHTFDELYDHRARLFSVIVRDYRDRAWKSRLHHDGTMYEGMFIVGVETPKGQATYHYDIDPYWDIFDCKELVRAPEWDGHTPGQAISRIASLRPACDRDALLKVADEIDADAANIAGYLDSCDGSFGKSDADEYYKFAGWADRIREALGVRA